jgi:hypothetical protein
MSNEPKICTHPKWTIDSQNIGTCTNPDCQEQRQFPLSSRDQVVILRESKCNSQIREGKKPTIQEDKETIIQENKETVKQEKESDMKTTGKKVTRLERHQYYEKHKKDIITDLLSLGRTATSKKWNIPTSSLFVLLNRWLTPEQIAQVDKVTAGFTQTLAAEPHTHLELTERMANIERQLFGLSYEEARPIYNCLIEAIRSMEGRVEVKIQFVTANQELIRKLERVLRIKSPLNFFES